jgi:hypothetical protein
MSLNLKDQIHYHSQRRYTPKPMQAAASGGTLELGVGRGNPKGSALWDPSFELPLEVIGRR